MRIFIFSCILFLSTSITFGQYVWKQKANYGGGERGFAKGFVINNRAYVGGGSSFGGSTHNNFEFWEYDAISDKWTQKKNLPVKTSYLVGFSLGNFGYLIGGIDTVTLEDQVWKYDPTSDVWIQQQNFPGASRAYSVAFTIGNKAYYGLGAGAGLSYCNDIWEYDPTTDTWTKKNNFPKARLYASAFSIGLNGYVCMGYDSSQSYVELYEYNSLSNKWRQRANFGGAGRSSAVAFSIGAKGYVGTGYNFGTYYNDFWEYDTLANTWQQIANLPAPGRHTAVAFAINNKGYVTTGYDGGGFGITGYKDLWEYSLNTSIDEKSNMIFGFDIFPNPTTNNVTIESTEKGRYSLQLINMLGEIIYCTMETIVGKTTIDVGALPKGIYIVQVTDTENKTIGRRRLVVQ